MKKFRALIIAVFLGAGWAVAQQQPSVPLKGTYEIQSGGSARKYELATDEVSVRDSAGRHEIKRVGAQNGTGTLNAIRAERAKSKAKAEVSPVFYEQGKPRSEFTRAHVTRQVLVKLAAGIRASDIASAAGVRVADTPSYAPDLAVLEAGSAEEALAAMEKLRATPGVLSADVLLAVQKQMKAVVNDTFYAGQWHLHNAGQGGGALWIDLNVEPAWNSGFDGTGVTIGIVDDGLQYTHPDLQPNYNASLSFDFLGNDSDPMPELIDDDGNPLTPMVISPHGTACAGLAAARGNNNVGVTGVAYKAGLAGIRLLGAAKTDQQEADAFNYRNDAISIKSNSWGEPDDGYTVGGPGLLAKAALINGVTNGRGGKGTIYIFPGGNGLANQDNSNYDGYANAIQVIAVGAVNDFGLQSYYGEPGANIAVVAPSSGGLHNQHITTTDLVGEDGFNKTAAGANDLADRNYTNQFGGTSTVCPEVAGVVALMLQANPNLGWRDVKEILMRTARPVHASDADWMTNGAGLPFNHKYGAGLVDAEAAVALAQGWTDLPVEKTAQITNSTAAAIANPNATTLVPTLVSRTFDFASTTNNPSNNVERVEHVEVTVNITHPSRGDLEIILTSPSGMTSRLAEQHGADSPQANYTNWTFSTVRHWGETARGTWTVTVADRDLNHPGGTLNSVVVKLHGSTNTGARLAGSSTTLTAESNLPANGAADPGETVTFDLGLKNIGATSIVASPGLTATLLPIGGVSSPSAAQNFGALTAGGAEVKKSFTFRANGGCGTMVKAVLQLQDGATSLGYASVAIPLGKTNPTQQFTSGAVSLPDLAVANPNPSTVAVSGVSGRVQNLTVQLTSLAHSYPDDLGMVLQGPAGVEIQFFDGGPTVSTVASPVNYTFSDNALIYTPYGGIVPTGTYKPFNEYGDSITGDPNVEPAFTLGEFDGLPANGSWKLFAQDLSFSTGSPVGSLANWKLTFTTVDCTDNVLFAQATATVDENVGLCAVVVRRTGGREGTATVNYATANGSAVAGSDYTDTSGTLTFLPGELEKTIPIPIIDDPFTEGAETFTVTLSAPTGNTQLGSAASQVTTVTIAANDPPTPVGISPASLLVNEADTQLTFTVSRATGATAGTVAFATANGSATAGSDYTATNGTLTFAANDLSKTFNVPILDDNVYEPNENFTVTLSNPTGGLILGADTVSTITIHDGDADSDGLPDDYETAHGLNPGNPADAALDSDGDGYTNLQEFIMGTDPQDANSKFSFTVTRSGADMKIAFPTVTGRTYTVEYSGVPASPWTPVQAGVPGTGGQVTITDTQGAEQTQRFYHVMVQMP